MLYEELHISVSTIWDKETEYHCKHDDTEMFMLSSS